MRATHMVHDREGRFRYPAIMERAALKGIDGVVLAAWSDDRNCWCLNGVEVKAVPVRHRPGKYDRVRVYRATLCMLMFDDTENIPNFTKPKTTILYKGQLHGAIERPWFTREALALSGRLWPLGVKPDGTVVDHEERRLDALVEYRDSLIRDGLLIPKETL